MLVCLIFLSTKPGLSQTTDTRWLVAVDGLAPALKAGIKKDLTEKFSLQGSAGFCIVGAELLSWNLFGSYKLTGPEKPLGFCLNFGLLDNYVNIGSPIYTLGFGGGAGIYYVFRNNSTLQLRLGAITGPSMDEGQFRWLTLPNFGLEYAFPPRRKK